MLVGKYIHNLVAKKFDVSREYAQLIYAQISSPRLDKVLKKWDRDNWASPEQRQKLAYIILVELLLPTSPPPRSLDRNSRSSFQGLYQDWSFADFNWNAHEDSQGLVRSTR